MRRLFLVETGLRFDGSRPWSCQSRWDPTMAIAHDWSINADAEGEDQNI